MIQRVYEVWTNLDEFFVKSGYGSREEMKKDLCLEKNGKPRLQLLFTALNSQEVKSQKDQEMLEELRQIFRYAIDSYDTLFSEDDDLSQVSATAEYYEEMKNEVVDVYPLLDLCSPTTPSCVSFRSLEEFLASPYILDTTISTPLGLKHYMLGDVPGVVDWNLRVRKEKFQELKNLVADKESILGGFLRDNLVRGSYKEFPNKYDRILVFDNSNHKVRLGANIFGDVTIVFKNGEGGSLVGTKNLDNGESLFLIGVG